MTKNTYYLSEGSLRILHQSISAGSKVRWLHNPVYHCCLSSSIMSIIATHVCQKWREVALSSANLWTRVPFSLPKWVPEVLRRSKEAPLTIDVFNDRSSYASIHHGLTLALKGLQHVKVLSLGGNLSRHTCNLLGDSLASTDAPILEKLSLQFPPSRRGETWTLPANLLCSHAPRLHDVLISGVVEVPWKLPVLEGLTYLHLAPTEGSPPSPEQLTTILRACPGLVRLALMDKALPATTHTTLPPVPSIFLASLKTLRLSGDIKNCACLASLLSVPLSTQITVKTTFDQHRNNVFEDSMVALSTLLRRTVYETGRLVWRSGRDPCRVQAWNIPIKNTQSNVNEEEPLLDFELHSAWGETLGYHQIEPLVIYLLDRSSLQHFSAICWMESVSISLQIMDVRQWRELMRPFTSLTMLNASMTGHFSISFLQSLDLSVDEGPKSSEDLTATTDGVYPMS